jgi:restriction endonuclease Mrr
MNAEQTYQNLTLILLQAVKNKKRIDKKEIKYISAKNNKMYSDESLQEAQGRPEEFEIQMQTAESIALKAGLIKRLNQEEYILSESGEHLLHKPMSNIRSKIADLCKEFSDQGCQFQESEQSILLTREKSEPDQDQMDISYSRIQCDLREDILAKIKQLTPEDFKELILQLQEQSKITLMETNKQSPQEEYKLDVLD